MLNDFSVYKYLSHRIIKIWELTYSRESLYFLGIMAVALGLRLFRLGAYAFWQDEAYNLIVSDHLGAAVMEGEFVSNNPPLFFALVALWRSIGFEGSEFGMRLLPALVGTVGIGIFFIIIRRFYGVRPALIGALLLAVNPLHVYHSQDLKDYILLTLTGPLAVYCLYRAWESNTVWAWVAYGLTASVACYSELFSGPLLLVANVWFLCLLPGRPGRLKGWFIANGLGALSFVPQLGIMLYRAQAMLVEAPEWWLNTPGIIEVVFFIKAMVFGYSDTKPFFYFAIIAYGLLCIFGIVFAWRMQWRETSFMLTWALGSIGVVFIVSHITHSIFLIRALMTYALPLFAFVGLALSRIDSMILRNGVLSVLVILSAIPLYEHYQGEYAPREFPHRPGVHPPRQFDAVTEHILENWKEGDVVAHAGPNTWASLYWYGLEEKTGFYVGVRKEFVDYFEGGHVPVTEREEFDGVFPHAPQEVVEGKQRVWLVFCEWEREYLPGNAYDVWRWMDARFPEMERKHFEGIDLYLYQVEAPVRTVRRDQDNGVTRSVEYTGAIEKTYEQERPDIGLIPKPVEERRGNLLLRFGNESEFEEEGEERNRVFTIKNRADRVVEARVEAIANDGLWRAASAYRREPLCRVWNVSAMSVDDGPPEQWPFSALTARVDEETDEKEAWARFCSLDPGRYQSWIYTRGTPMNRETRRADIHINANGVDLAGPMPRNEAKLEGWRWFKGHKVTVPEEEPCLDLILRAVRNPDFDTSWFEVGYIVFKHFEKREDRKELRGDISGVTLEPWPGRVELEAGESASWSVSMREDRKRLDVWVYEKEEDGKAYWIFEEFD